MDSAGFGLTDVGAVIESNSLIVLESRIFTPDALAAWIRGCKSSSSCIISCDFLPITRIPEEAKIRCLAGQSSETMSVKREGRLMMISLTDC